MKLKNVLISASILILVIACNKNNDISGTEEISGTLFYRNTLTDISDSIKIPNSELFIQFKNRGTSTYLYKVVTDADGKFKFTNLTKNESYYIFKNWEKDGVKYLVKDIVKAAKKDLPVILIPDESTQNGFHISLIDDNLKTPVSNFKLWVFTNKLLADNNDTAGYVFSLKTNDYGKAFKLGIQPGSYYVNAKDSIGSVRLKGKKTIVVPNPGITKETFELMRF
jgi:hypothetical protein